MSTLSGSKPPGDPLLPYTHRPFRSSLVTYHCFHAPKYGSKSRRWRGACKRFLTSSTFEWPSTGGMRIIPCTVRVGGLLSPLSIVREVTVSKNSQGIDWWRIFSAPINNLHIFTETGNDAAQACANPLNECGAHRQAPNYRSVLSKFSTSSDVAICLGCCC
jgi:hypothetical protein